MTHSSSLSWHLDKQFNSVKSTCPSHPWWSTLLIKFGGLRLIRKLLALDQKCVWKITGMGNSKHRQSLCLLSMASSYPNIWFWDMHLKLLLVSHFPFLLYPKRQKTMSKLCHNCPFKAIAAARSLSDSDRGLHHCPCTETASSKTLMNHNWDQTRPRVTMT